MGCPLVTMRDLGWLADRARNGHVKLYRLRLLCAAPPPSD